MKQVKKLLVILPLVALFVLGSLPVLAAEKYDKKKIMVMVDRYESDGSTNLSTEIYTELLTAVLPKTELDAAGNASGAIGILKTNLKAIIEGKNKEFEIDDSSLTAAVAALATKIGDATAASPYDASSSAIKLIKKEEETSETTTKPTTEIKSTDRSIDVFYFENMAGVGTGKEYHRIYNLPNDFLQNAIGAGETFEFSLRNLDRVQAAIQKFVEDQLQDGYRPIGTTYRDAANTLLTTSDVATVRMGRPVARTYKVIAYDIHHNRFVFDRLFELEMEDGWRSERDVSKSFYDHSDTLSANYLYAGFATRNIAPVIVFRATYLETIARANYLRALNRYDAEIVTFVVPRIINVTTYHVFPENTRDDLIERVPVPYETWASLQFSSQFMNLPEIFKTRIQKVNEMGFSFREIRYYSGINEITGLLSGYDWNGDLLTSDGDDACFAKVFYDKAVAAAKEEKKVDAATAPQAQIQAPAAGQAQAPVTAANTTTTTAPANTLPVTGASDSIFLFLSSAALMAVGILFFKKH